MSKDLYQEVTDKIITALESGTRPWIKPWSVKGLAGRPLRHDGTPYKGINILLLWSAQAANDWTSDYWMTFNQAKALGGSVKKGQHGEHIVFFKPVVKTEHNDETGEDEEHKFAILKGYVVFNVDQIEGLPERYYRVPEPLPEPQLIEHCERFFTNTGATIKQGGDRACFIPSADIIRMPVIQSFNEPEAYYSTLAHEMTHWTGAKTRLDRTFGKRFGDDLYAAEELVAELGSAFLGADLGIEVEPREDHASYLASWLKCLKADKKAIFTAASLATKAVEYLEGLQTA